MDTMEEVETPSKGDREDELVAAEEPNAVAPLENERAREEEVCREEKDEVVEPEPTPGKDAEPKQEVSTIDLVLMMVVSLALLCYPVISLTSAISAFTNTVHYEEDLHNDEDMDPGVVFQRDEPQSDFCETFGIAFTPFVIILAKVIMAEVGFLCRERMQSSMKCLCMPLLIAYVLYEAVIDLLSYGALMDAFWTALAPTEATPVWDIYGMFLLLLSQSSLVEKILIYMATALCHGMTSGEEGEKEKSKTQLLSLSLYGCSVFVFSGFYICIFTHMLPMVFGMLPFLLGYDVVLCFFIGFFIALPTEAFRVTQYRPTLLRILLSFSVVWIVQLLVICGILMYSDGGIYNGTLYNFELRSLSGWAACYAENLKAGRTVTILDVLAMF